MILAIIMIAACVVAYGLWEVFGEIIIERMVER